MNIPRRIEPEWLDEFPAEDSRAMRSRRDLRRVNAMMGNAIIVARELGRSYRGGPPRLIAEIGAGDGTFMLRLAERASTRWQDVNVVLLDRQDIVGAATLHGFVRLGWRAKSVTADVFEWLAQPADQVYDVIIANLFLHHFDAARLTILLSLLAQRARMFIACEPRRSGLSLVGSRLLGLIGCNDVSRHDAVVSVRAGFDGKELSALWSARRAWKLQERANGVFSHCFVACRAGGDSAVGRGEEW